jgi:hypothetical protein
MVASFSLCSWSVPLPITNQRWAQAGGSRAVQQGAMVPLLRACLHDVKKKGRKLSPKLAPAGRRRPHLAMLPVVAGRR